MTITRGARRTAPPTVKQSLTVDTLGSLRLRAERAEARVAELEGQNTTLRFNSAARPQYQPPPELHGWDVKQ